MPRTFATCPAIDWVPRPRRLWHPTRTGRPWLCGKFSWAFSSADISTARSVGSIYISNSMPVAVIRVSLISDRITFTFRSSVKRRCERDRMRIV